MAFLRPLLQTLRLAPARPNPHFETYALLAPAEHSTYLDDPPAPKPGKSPYNRIPQTRCIHVLLLVAMLGVLACLSVIISELQHRNHDFEVMLNSWHSESPTSPPQAPRPPYVPWSQMDPETYARWSLDTLDIPSKRDGPPPQNFDKWFQFAREKSCLIDEYDHIYLDFEPFYQIAEKDPKFFKKMIDLATAEAKDSGISMMKTAQVRDGVFIETDNNDAAYGGDWQRTFDRFVKILPDMDLLLNGHDEPRVLFNYRKPGAMDRAFLPDPKPFHHTPSPTSQAYEEQKLCLVPNNPSGFVTSLANEASAFLIDATFTDFTTELYPILSMTRITPCFSDILVPSEYYYSDAWWSPKYAFPNNVHWSNKKPQIYWRGRGTGGHINGSDFHMFPRFRAADIAKNHTDIMDIRITGLNHEHCGELCDGDAIKKEYDIKDASEPRENVYGYKFVLDVDGNSFSSRYLGLLRSGSLVFKSTIFSEFFDLWLKPYVHYIPVLPDLSDLEEKVRWAIRNDDAARRIQETGRVFAQEVMNDAQNDCYFAAVLLEWAQVQAYANER
ncbi:glycosyl transferase family 90-domain-containing protein [Mycena floridula]|nr:glycosyl transferase family 90-domain-containing protein [Mycena floridula]